MKELREIKEASKIALKLMNELIVTEFKINKKTPKHISNKYNIPYYYILDLTMNLKQFEYDEIDELKSFFKKAILEDDMSLTLITALRKGVLDKLEFGNECDSSSNGEKKITEYLQQENIFFHKEKTFDDLIYVSNLRFDFYIPKQNIAIEFDGIQHYKPVGYFGGNDAFIETQKRDKLKDIYCKEKNIKLVRIPYFEINNINTILDGVFSGN